MQNDTLLAIVDPTLCIIYELNIYDNRHSMKWETIYYKGEEKEDKRNENDDYVEWDEKFYDPCLVMYLYLW